MGVEITDPETLRERMTAWLPGMLAVEGVPVDDLRVEPVTRPKTGQSNETVFVTASWTRAGVPAGASFVARLQPRANQMFLDADVVREGNLISRLASDTTIAVPPIRAVVSDPDILGVPFFIMDRIEGHVPSGRPSIHVDPWLQALTDAQRRTLVVNALDGLCEVHAVQPSVVSDVLEVSPGSTTIESAVGHLRRWYDWARRGRAFPLLDHALDVLEGEAPEGSAPVLLWGDPRLGNMIFDDQLRVAAVLDWEIASVGPAELDLGWWLMMDEFARRGAGERVLPGFLSRQETIDHYRSVSGRQPVDLPFSELLAAVKLAVTLIPAMDSLIARSILRPDTRFADENVPTQIVADLLGEPEPQVCADYRRLSGMS